jgi:hypothetical protein
MTSTWFERAVRPEHVAEELRGRVPELVEDPQRLAGVRMIRLRSAEDEGHWTATYLLDLPGRTIAARGLLVPPGSDPPASAAAEASTAPFAGDGWSCWLPDSRVLLHTRTADESIPGLAAMTDPRSACEVLGALLRSAESGGPFSTPVEVTTTVAAYKPGVRVTMICDLGYAVQPAQSGSPGAVDPAGPPTVVVKATAGAESLALHEVQRALWDSPLATDQRLRIARPLGHVPELGMAVQAHLEHDRTLKDLLAGSFSGAPPGREQPGMTQPGQTQQTQEPTDALRATAAALAALHTSGVRHGRLVSFEDELAITRRKHDDLAAVVPWLSHHTAGVLDRLAAAATHSDPQPPAPSHGSFRTAQVLLPDGGGIGLIDLDKLRQAEPAADVGPFLAKLRHTAVNKGTDSGALPDEATMAERSARVDALRAAFLAAYEEQAPLSRERAAVWEGLELVSLVLGSAKKGLTERGASCARMLHDHLRSAGI